MSRRGGILVKEFLPQINQFARSSWTRILTGSVLRKDGEPCFISRRPAATRCRSAGLAVSGSSSLPLGDREMKWAFEEQWNESSEAHFSPLGFVQFAERIIHALFVLTFPAFVLALYEYVGRSRTSCCLVVSWARVLFQAILHIYVKSHKSPAC